MANNSKHTQTEGLDLILFSIPSEILLQFGGCAMLMGLVGGKAIAQTQAALGQASEEVFRGDRLPILKFPEQTELQ